MLSANEIAEVNQAQRTYARLAGILMLGAIVIAIGGAILSNIAGNGNFAETAARISGLATRPNHIAGGPGGSAQTPGAGPVLIVTYVEAPPAKGAALAADLHAYAGQIENGPGKPRVTVLREFGRPNRMVIIEQWPDTSSPAFAKSETELAAMVQPDLRAPMDRRVNHPLTPALTQMASTAFVVLMHVDMSLAGPAALKVLQAQRDSVLAAPDALGYEDAVQDQHENHFAVCEVWKSRTAYEAYTATGPAEDFRRQLAALLGSPFDDRFYERLGH